MPATSRLLLLVVVTMLAAACAPAGGRDDSIEAAATVYPLTWVISEVAPDADIAELNAAGQDPHDLELTPQQQAALERAAVVTYLGPIGFQPQVEAAVRSASGEVVDVTDVVAEGRLRTIDDSAAGPVDPHVWFDAAVMADVTVAVGEAFAAADAEHAATYRANAKATAEELRALGDEIAATLRGCQHDQVIVSHEAYAYLLAPHGLAQHGISSAAGHGGASPQDIARLAAEVRQAGLPAVLTEPVEGRTDAEVVAAEAGVDLLEIYSLDIVDAEQAQMGFPALVRQQAEAVATAAGCTGEPQ